LSTELTLAKSEIKVLRALNQEQANIIEEKENQIREITFKFQKEEKNRQAAENAEKNALQARIMRLEMQL